MSGWLVGALGSNLLLALPVALLAGLISFVSPCVLPLLPAYLSYASGLGAAEITAGHGSRRALVGGTLGFVVGFAAVFVTTGAVFGGLASLLLTHQRTITLAAGILIILLAAVFAGWIPLPLEWRPIAPNLGVVFSPLLGVAFGIGWTPCIGPTLSVVLSLALTEGSALRGAVLAFGYALGLGVPFVAFALAFGRLQGSFAWLSRHQGGMQLFGGVFMLLVGLAMVTGLWDLAMAGLRTWIAGFGTIL